jgi:hypothetical protein
MSGVMDCNKKITLSPDVLLEIEEALNTPHFFGIPVGVTLNDSMVIALYNAKRVWNWRAQVTDYLRYYYQYFHQPSFGYGDLDQYKGRMLFTWLFDRADMKALVLPLVENYNSDDTIVVGSLSSMRAQLAEDTAFVSWDEFPKIDMKLWRREFDRCVPIWRQRLVQVLKQHAVPTGVAVFLLSRLQVQTQRIMAAELFLNMVKPRVVVTECDRSNHSSCLVLAAKKVGIPAVTMIHGALESYPSYGLAPILSNFACCWGEAHRRNFLEHGVDGRCLVITGCHSISRTLDVKQDVARLGIGLPLDKPVVLLATSPIKLEDRLKYAQVFCIAMSRLPDMSAIVRLHPAESVDEYKELVNEHPNVKFFSNKAMSREESLAASDIIVSHESSFGFDALLKGKLVVILDVLATPLKVVNDLIEIASCSRVTSAEELEFAIKRIVVDGVWRKSLHESAEQYSLQYCNSYGQNAVNNVCRVIGNAIENSQDLVK